MLLTTLFFGLFALAIWHFVVDGILAPSHQFIVKAELLRTIRGLDEVKRACGHDADLRAYRILRRAAESLLRHQSAYSVVSVVQTIGRLSSDPELQRQVAERSEILEGSTHPELRAVRGQIARLARTTLSWNSVGWTIYVIPILVAAAMWRSTHNVIKALLTMPEPQLAKMDHAAAITGWGGNSK